MRESPLSTPLGIVEEPVLMRTRYWTAATGEVKVLDASAMDVEDDESE